MSFELVIIIIYRIVRNLFLYSKKVKTSKATFCIYIEKLFYESKHKYEEM